MPLDHLGYYVSPKQLEREVSFLLAALAPLQVREIIRPFPTVVGMGTPNDPYLWVAASEDKGNEDDKAKMERDREAFGGEDDVVVNLHVAVKAGSTAEVDAFHSAALAAGGVDNGKPGVRKEYHPGYYAAFAKSPAGMNLEVVHHDMPSSCPKQEG